MFRVLRLSTVSRPYSLASQRFYTPTINRYLSSRAIPLQLIKPVSQQQPSLTQLTRHFCSPPPPPPPAAKPELSKKDQLKKAFKDYGATIIVFHVGISLVSLGGFYMLVSSGLDVVALVEKLGFSSETVGKAAVSNAGTFVVAYGIHKIFAPVRISVTLFSAPFIVRYLRARGIIKPPQPPKF